MKSTHILACITLATSVLCHQASAINAEVIGTAAKKSGNSELVTNPPPVVYDDNPFFTSTPTFNNDAKEDVELALSYFGEPYTNLQQIAKSDNAAQASLFDFTVDSGTISFEFSSVPTTPVLFTVVQANAFTIYKFVPGELNTFIPPFKDSKGAGTDISHITMWTAAVPETTTVLLTGLGAMFILGYRKFQTRKVATA